MFMELTQHTMISEITVEVHREKRRYSMVCPFMPLQTMWYIWKYHSNCRTTGRLMETELEPFMTAEFQDEILLADFSTPGATHYIKFVRNKPLVYVR
jgi:hypothetical protein